MKSTGRDPRPLMLRESATLLDATRVLHEGAVGIVLVVDDSDRLLGVMTSHDIGKATLKENDLSAPVRTYVTRNPVTAEPALDDDQILILMRHTQRYQIPIIDAERRVVGLRVIADFLDLVPLSVPHLKGNEWTYLKDCLDTNFVSSVGPYVERFERDVAAYLGVKHGVACITGTAAIHTACMLAGVGPGTEVLVPAVTFIAPVNAVAYCGGRPVFIDSEERTLGLCPKSLEAFLENNAEVRGPGQVYNRMSGARISCVIAVHIFGHPADVEAIREVCDRYGLFLIEDAAESIGSTFNGRHTGTVGHVGCLSFNGNKIVTAGGGGMVVTDDGALAQRARHLTTQAKSNAFRYEHDEIGFNYRLPNVLAAIGVAQLEQLDRNLTRKREVAQRYRDLLSNVSGVEVFWEQQWARSNYWLNTIFVAAERKDVLLKYLNDHRIMARPVWQLNQRQQMFRDCQAAPLPNATKIYDTAINLPSSVGITDAEVDYVCHLVQRFMVSE